MRCISIIIILLFFQNNFAQESSDSIPIVAYWSKGDSFNYKITKTKKSWKKDSLSQNNSSSYWAEFKVIDSTENSYTISWEFKKAFSDYKQDESTENILKNFDFNKVVYKTDEFGALIEIMNWKEVAEMVEAVLDNTLSKARNKFPEKEKELNDLKEMFTTEEAIESLIFPELTYLHQMFGYLLPVNGKFDYQDHYPSLFSDELLRTNSSLYFYEIDPEAEYCVIVNENKVNRQDMQRELKKFFDGLNIEDSTEISEMNIDIQDFNVYKMYYYPGIVTKIETNRKAVTNLLDENYKTEESILIELQEE